MKLPVSKLLNNTGQLRDKGVPKNPRFIKDDEYKKLIKSIQEDKDYLNHEQLHVIEYGDKYIVLNGNQRLRALKELGIKETAVTVYDKDTPAEIIRSRIIKSNHSYGKDDMDALANDGWDLEDLSDWGLIVHDTNFDDIDSFFESTSEDAEKEPQKHKCPKCGHEF